jgi:hypothetical protein
MYVRFVARPSFLYFLVVTTAARAAAWCAIHAAWLEWCCPTLIAPRRNVCVHLVPLCRCRLLLTYRPPYHLHHRRMPPLPLSARLQKNRKLHNYLGRCVFLFFLFFVFIVICDYCLVQLGGIYLLYMLLLHIFVVVVVFSRCSY